ncbi:MAG: 16S rRNA (cytosine(1402)-N(4))-methyltransferase RsmH [Hyphomicrobiales bacterium]|nr:16S rRNA (cytosine(1402)-N(4))-methyltransferase RsmH [Hyphomicrobiales bacterium]MCP5371204.1 16S rRNA (cytosine(1402)-N(4))-methyltransferase RsmH [Hyphomicrobiales bacterium]
MARTPHAPVMLREVLDLLAPRDGAVFVDATFGAGGYTRALLESCACTVWGIDRDPTAVEMGRELSRAFPGRLEVVHGRYGDMVDLLAGRVDDGVDGIAFDLGVSSMQLDRFERGFSFRGDGPLDMRMGGSELTAADVVNDETEAGLADIIHRYGEEKAARRVARAIVAARAQGPITRTAQLADVVRGVVRGSRDGIDPATRTFQALRIFVNDELGELDRGLGAAEALLKPGGRLAVVSFHSLEDRRVKSFLRQRGGEMPAPSRHLPPAAAGRAATFHLLSRGAQKPGADEVAANPRARSARLRGAARTAAPAWPAN